MDLTVIFKIALIGFVSAVVSMVLKRADKEDVASLVSIAGLVVALAILANSVLQLYDTISGLFEL